MKKARKELALCQESLSQIENLGTVVGGSTLVCSASFAPTSSVGVASIAAVSSVRVSSVAALSTPFVLNAISTPIVNPLGGNCGCMPQDRNCGVNPGSLCR